ncbi:dGTPase [Cupriavidus cauae]|nr:dGTPase [Cupriavidus cauae]
MTYSRWITEERAQQSSRTFASVNQAIESDRGRILFSSPFRRLQNKAQVFSLEGNAAVRSRLTHSLEVAHIGRYIAQEVLSRFEKGSKLSEIGLLDRQSAFVTLVENACLLHDIGNPPFGHFGEAAIRAWFGGAGRKAFCEATGLSEKEAYFDGEYQDFLRFDGNAQGFRIITRLQGEDGTTGLNLTFSQLASYLKYVTLPQDVNGELRICKKPGYFNTEADIVDKIRAVFSLGAWQRFPLAALMEAADDIAYCLSDIEDGIEKRLITFDEFICAVHSTAAETVGTDPLNAELQSLLASLEDGRLSKFVQVRTRVFNHAVQHVAQRFVEHHDAICAGEHVELIEPKCALERLFSAIRKNVARRVYSSPEAEHVELAGNAVVYGLLENFARILRLPAEQAKAVLEDDVEFCKRHHLDLEMRLAHMLPDAALRAYRAIPHGNTEAIAEWHARAHLILDYICGMTDNFALKTFQLLSGIRVGEGNG